MAFDRKCFELAEYFSDEAAQETEKTALAQWIQDSIERWLRVAEMKKDDDAAIYQSFRND
jgi:hypothetical protein